MSKTENPDAIRAVGADLNSLLRAGDAGFFCRLRDETECATEFGRLMVLNTLRRRAIATGIPMPAAEPLRMAFVGGSTLRPFADLAEHLVSTLAGCNVENWIGDFDNYVSEIVDRDSPLYDFQPDVVCILPAEGRCRFTGSPADPVSTQREQADQIVAELLGLCATVRERTGAEVILGNFRLPPCYDPGPARSRSLASDYAFRKHVNTELGLAIPAYVHLCDIEFLANRLGLNAAWDDRSWFESKQPFSVGLAVSVAREVCQIVRSIKQPSKKVIVLDLDNTLWGGVIGDDDLEGIEIGATSPRGEAFRHFQSYLLSLSKRGVLLAVCSKNDYLQAVRPFGEHPEMVLRLSNIVNFKANWEPKSDNIRQIAAELNLGLDSFVFVDDNPAEVDLVRRFLPEVTSICLGEDPSTFTRKLQDSRLFEFRNLTDEDLERLELYRRESQRAELQGKATDLNGYLESLEMVADLSPFSALDAPRIAQLINKSNQFNLTTRRRTESEVQEIAGNPNFSAFSVRLSDRFGDHGLIAVVVGEVVGRQFVVDTWLMSCRVLKRQVEELTLNEIVRRAADLDCTQVIGIYRPTPKNEMVRTLYPRLGFEPLQGPDEEARFVLQVAGFTDVPTNIRSRPID